MAGSKISVQACFAEFIAMMLFVIIGCGSAVSLRNGLNTENDDMFSHDPSWVLLVAMAFGIGITVLAYTIGHYSGGHINCAVTLGLVLTGNCPLMQGIANFLCQMLGSIAGAFILAAIVPKGADHTGGLGSNGLSTDKGYTWYNALVGEIVGTFILMFVVLQTACNPKSENNRTQACIAIGFSVFLAHCVLIPIDGCSINPTRSFGPAVVASIPSIRGGDHWKDMWIFWVGPLLGASIAAMTYMFMEKISPKAEAYAAQDEEGASSED
jgi:MIP family channel proteins